MRSFNALLSLAQTITSCIGWVIQQFILFFDILKLSCGAGWRQWCYMIMQCNGTDAGMEDDGGFRVATRNPFCLGCWWRIWIPVVFCCIGRLTDYSCCYNATSLFSSHAVPADSLHGLTIIIRWQLSFRCHNMCSFFPKIVKTMWCVDLPVIHSTPSWPILQVDGRAWTVFVVCFSLSASSIDLAWAAAWVDLGSWRTWRTGSVDQLVGLNLA